MAASNRPALETYIQPQFITLCNAIRLPPDSSFELKPSVLQLLTTRLQFGGLSCENPLEHLSEFTSLCEGFKGGSTAEVTMMSLFPYTLRDRAKRWLLQLPTGSITSWDDLSKAFLAEYYSAAKILEFRKAISSFTQDDGESVFEAWDRLKELIRLCPQHGVTEPLLMQQFYGGMNDLGKQVLDGLNPQGGGFNGMNEIDARNALERMYRTSKNWRTNVRTKPQRSQVSMVNSSFEEQLENLRINMNSQINALQGRHIQPVYQVCEFCQGPHFSGDCQGNGILTVPEETEYVEFANTTPTMGNTYNPNWRNHPNFSWRNTSGNMSYQRTYPRQPPQGAPYQQQQPIALPAPRSFNPPKDPMQ